MYNVELYACCSIGRVRDITFQITYFFTIPDIVLANPDSDSTMTYLRIRYFLNPHHAVLLHFCSEESMAVFHIFFMHSV